MIHRSEENARVLTGFRAAGTDDELSLRACGILL
jgi:hypothetical protein